MNRELSVAEIAVVEKIIRHAPPSMPNEITVSTKQRDYLIQLLPFLRVTGTCSCGCCPSVYLHPTGDWPQPVETFSYVLDSWTEDDPAMVMLFIENGLPTFLEVAPFGDFSVSLPDSDALRFDFKNL